MEQFKEESPKTPSPNKAMGFKEFMRSHNSQLYRAGKKKLTQTNYLQQRMQYNEKYLKMSLVEKYMETRKRSYKYRSQLKGEIERSRRIQRDAKTIFADHISPRLFNSMQGPAFLGRLTSRTPDPRSRLCSQGAPIRPLSPSFEPHSLVSPKSCFSRASPFDTTKHRSLPLV